MLYTICMHKVLFLLLFHPRWWKCAPICAIEFQTQNQNGFGGRMNDFTYKMKVTLNANEKNEKKTQKSARKESMYRSEHTENSILWNNFFQSYSVFIAIFLYLNFSVFLPQSESIFLILWNVFFHSYWNTLIYHCILNTTAYVYSIFFMKSALAHQ